LTPPVGVSRRAHRGGAHGAAGVMITRRGSARIDGGGERRGVGWPAWPALPTTGRALRPGSARGWFGLVARPSVRWPRCTRGGRGISGAVGGAGSGQVVMGVGGCCCEH
jgi:hypothetical protein